MSFDELGFEMIESVLTLETVQTLLAELTKLTVKPLSGGIRRIEQQVEQVATLATSVEMLAIAGRYLSSQPKLVRAIYFDKSPMNNWLVSWHQDRTVSVSERFEAEGWKLWTLKAGAWHIQPPLDVLERMVTIRLHLDDAKIANGCLKIMPCSHKLGILPTGAVLEHIVQEQVVYCEVLAGDAVVMRPHILHASEKSSESLPRRILHFEYSDYQLPTGISWSS